MDVNDILKWFRTSDDVLNFLEKNVRGFLGLKKINKAIAKSYSECPNWFWYKHNGIIIFADNLTVDRTDHQLILRNPQVVNGGQTLRTLYSAYDRQGRQDNPGEGARAGLPLALRGHGDVSTEH